MGELQLTLIQTYITISGGALHKSSNLNQYYCLFCPGGKALVCCSFCCFFVVLLLLFDLVKAVSD